ncbi:MAG: hypothetical protein IH586_18905, partial [Anaerolineaceae bacterium]|nr:hypothetical protein [Anaerolineaceae bacterium]
VSGVMLQITLPRRIQWCGAGYSILVVALLAGASILAQRVDYHRLTEARAERITRAIDVYHVRTGSYPAGLGQLVPWYTLSIPEPVIIPGLNWCYQGLQNTYRLAYISRSHWSDPNLFGVVYKTAGDVSQLPPACALEISAFQSR